MEDKKFTKKFTKRDEGFTCANCGAEVLPLGYTSRNHCPACLHSMHLDINPGDRMNGCGGLMVPIDVMDTGKGYVIVHKCEKCSEIRRNKAAVDARTQPDDFEQMLLIKRKAVNNIT